MRVVLLVLSGDPQKVRRRVEADYPGAQVESVARSDIEGTTIRERLRIFRALKPEVFVIATERLRWQRGKNLFMLFGVLAGAREVLMIDAHDRELKRSRASLLVGWPFVLGGDAIGSATTIVKARRELRRLELSTAQNFVDPRSESTPRPNILFLRSTPGPGTQAGGAASHIKGVVEGLVELGADVEVITNDEIAGFNESKAKITVVDPISSGSSRATFDIKSNLSFTSKLLPLMHARRPDLIYQRYARFSWAGVVAALETKRPLFLEYNGSEVWVGKHWDRVGKLDLLERFEQLNLQAATRIFVVSDVERRNLENRGVKSEKIVINPNGVDTELFRPGVGGVKVRRELHISETEIAVGFVGTFGPWHGVSVFAEAIKLIPAEAPLRFILVGSGSSFGEVQKILDEEVETGRVVLTGPVKHAEVPPLLDACDILVSPHVPLTDGSEFFGSPTKLFEYMAMGKGIVASRLGQISDVLDDGESALLLTPGDARALAQAIQQLSRSKELRVRLGHNARQTVMRKYTWRHNAQKVLDAYHSLRT